MQTKFISLLLLLLLLSGCKEKCSDPITISSIVPDANPAGYEILITGEGLSESSQVFFSNTEDPTVRRSEAQDGLIATVPSGLPVGTITLSVQQGGECIASRDFDVWGEWSASVPQAPLNLVIPVPPAAYPTSINNFWPNAYDPDHGFFLQDEDGDDILDEFSEETHNDPKKTLFRGNPISGSYNETTGKVALQVDRTGNGGNIAKYTGEIVDPKRIKAKGIDIPDNAILALLLVEEGSGRQLLLVTF